MTNKKWFKNWSRFKVVHLLVYSSNVRGMLFCVCLKTGHIDKLWVFMSIVLLSPFDRRIIICNLKLNFNPTLAFFLKKFAYIKIEI